MVKIANPANNEVAQFVKQTMRASWKQLLLKRLYEDKATNPPHAALNEKKI